MDLKNYTGVGPAQSHVALNASFPYRPCKMSCGSTMDVSSWHETDQPGRPDDVRWRGVDRKWRLGAVRTVLDPMLTSVDSHRTPTASEAPPLAQAPDGYLRVAPVFRGAPRPTASDAVAWRWQAAHDRARAKKGATIPRARDGICRHFSARFTGRTKIWPG